MAEEGEASPANVLPSFDDTSKGAKDPRAIEKEVNATKGVALDATMLPTAT